MSLTTIVGVAAGVKQNKNREGSFFSKSKLTLQKWLLLMMLWARDRSVTDAMDDAQLCR